MNHDEEKKVVLPLSEIYCAPDRRCCGYGNDCPGLYKVLPTGRIVWEGCGC